MLSLAMAWAKLKYSSTLLSLAETVGDGLEGGELHLVPQADLGDGAALHLAEGGGEFRRHVVGPVPLGYEHVAR